PRRALPRFPTRRSSDLGRHLAQQRLGLGTGQAGVDRRDRVDRGGLDGGLVERGGVGRGGHGASWAVYEVGSDAGAGGSAAAAWSDRKSTRLNSSHSQIS